MRLIASALACYDRLCAKLVWVEWLPPLLTRIAVGVIMTRSGWGKLHDLPTNIERFRGWHIPAPEFQAPFAAGTELVCGCLLIAGLFTRLAAIPLAVVMTVAIAKVVYDPADPVGTLGVSELLTIILMLWLIVHGGGALSLDRLLVRLRGRSSDALIAPSAS